MIHLLLHSALHYYTAKCCSTSVTKWCFLWILIIRRVYWSVLSCYCCIIRVCCCFTAGQETSRIQMTRASLLSLSPLPFQPCQQYSDDMIRKYSYSHLGWIYISLDISKPPKSTQILWISGDPFSFHCTYSQSIFHSTRCPTLYFTALNINTNFTTVNSSEFTLYFSARPPHWWLPRPGPIFHTHTFEGGEEDRGVC